MTASAKKTVSYLIKATIVVLAFAGIYHQYLKKDEGIRDFKILVAGLSHNEVIFTISAIVLLMLANWVLEAYKWRYVTRKLINITPWKAIESVFCGLTWAIFTPNRIGEYGGRVMFLPYRKRIFGVFAMAVTAFGQNLLTNVLGLIALMWFLYRFANLNTWVFFVILLPSIAFMVFIVVLYFHIRWVVSLLDSISFIKKYHKFFDIMGRYKSNELLNIIYFALARFFVFTFQYYLVIHMLIPQLPVFEMVMLLFVFFFIQSALPSLDLFDIGVRSLTAVTLFNYVTGQHIAIIASVSLIYVINLIFPAIIGTVFVFKLKFFDRTA